MWIEKYWADYSHSAFLAGCIGVLVSYAGPLAVVFQAAQSAQLSPEQISSWIWAISLGSGVPGIYLSWKYKMPVIIAWSTSAAALLVVSLAQYSYAEVIGAYIVSALLVVLVGVTGVFQKLMQLIPRSIATAMLAGILCNFGIAVFTSLQHAPLVILPVILAYLLGKRLYARYAVLFALATSFAVIYLFQLSNPSHMRIALAMPVFTMPALSVSAIIGLAIPLFLVTMTSQNVPGIAVLQADGYAPNASPFITATGLSSLLLAPFGCHGISLAAITAAICTGPEAHPDKDKRYISGIASGAVYCIVAVFGATLAGIFSALPNTVIASIAGLALLAAIANSLSIAMANEAEREAALITFLLTASQFSLFGIGSAFWGLLGGMAAYALLVMKKTSHA